VAGFPAKARLIVWNDIVKGDDASSPNQRRVVLPVLLYSLILMIPVDEQKIEFTAVQGVKDLLFGRWGMGIRLD
jgi:hypothetical protein